MLEVVLFVNVYLLVITVVQGVPMEVYTNGANGVIKDLITLGVDAKECTSIVYEVKACKDHGLSLLDTNGAELVEFVIGGWFNDKSRLTIKPTSVKNNAHTTSILHCNEYRWFWAFWGNGSISYGKGKTIGINKVFDVTDPTGVSVKRFGLKGFNSEPHRIRLGETCRGGFLSVCGKWTNGLIEDKFNTDYLACAWRCFLHAKCGMFSHRGSQERCALFDRTTSSFRLISDTDWKSWKMLYCNA
ncbi:uncharacterized protein LOC124277077 [Haliotis rubra]|uniref:uncharacterized protein LOC124277077 n=1 Tax=Haliotis rubra TaxID=36100 RepID=UPI001EE62D69|nr:uncharacterized protein LOC124277077 [Haliotis rubra]